MPRHEVSWTTDVRDQEVPPPTQLARWTSSVERHRDRDPPEAVVPMDPAVPGSYRVQTQIVLMQTSSISQGCTAHFLLVPDSSRCFILPSPEN